MTTDAFTSADLAVPCPGCAAAVGRPCITPAGVETTPHTKRALARAAIDAIIATD